jgi:hypothetical protein
MPERYHQLAGTKCRRHKSRLGIRAQDATASSSEPDCRYTGYMSVRAVPATRHTMDMESPNPAMAAAAPVFPALSLSPLSLLSLIRSSEAYFRRLAFSPSLLHKKRRRTIHRLTIDPVQQHGSSQLAAINRKFGCWCNQRLCPTFRSCNDTHARMNIAIDGESATSPDRQGSTKRGRVFVA